MPALTVLGLVAGGLAGTASADPGYGNGYSTFPSVSADGRYVAFTSDDTDLVPGDTNGAADVFVRDLSAGTTTRVSVSSAGRQADGASREPAISANGRFVAYSSDATDLVPGDTNGVSDVFVYDLRSGATARVSVGGSGAQGDGGAFDPQLDRDGSRVSFNSAASNLVPGDANRTVDVFVRDRRTGTTLLVDRDPATHRPPTWGASDGSLSANGTLVAFGSGDPGLDPDRPPGPGRGGGNSIYVRDLSRGSTTGGLYSSTSRRGPYDGGALLSADGTSVAFASYRQRSGATVQYERVWHWRSDRVTRPGEGVNWDSEGGPMLSAPAISPNGRVMVDCRQTDTGGALHVLTVHGRLRTGPPCDVSRPSFHGHYVAFVTAAALDPHDGNGVEDVYLWDRARDTTTRISRP